MNFTTALENIKNGSKFNGVLYTTFRNKNNVTFSIYVDGEYVKVDDVRKDGYLEEKANFEAQIKEALCPIASSETFNKAIDKYGDSEVTRVIADFHKFCEGED